MSRSLPRHVTTIITQAFLSICFLYPDMPESTTMSTPSRIPVARNRFSPADEFPPPSVLKQSTSRIPKPAVNLASSQLMAAGKDAGMASVTSSVREDPDSKNAVLAENDLGMAQKDDSSAPFARRITPPAPKSSHIRHGGDSEASWFLHSESGK